MYSDIRMQRKKDNLIILEVTVPLLPGSLSTAQSTCGKPHCACKQRPPKLHGVYYRWTGTIQGKRTTKTISKEQAQECQRRIENYRRLQRQIEKILAEALAKAPWERRTK
jgi:uncharacterized protein involved in tolerance to divalent cations